MKRAIVFLASISAVAIAAAQSSIPQKLLSDLNSLPKKSLSYKNGVIRVVSSKPAVDHAEFSSSSYSLCHHYWIKPLPKYMANFSLRRFEYVGSTGKQGFAFNNPAQACASVLKSKGIDAFHKQLDANTWVCSGLCQPLGKGKKISDYK